MVRLLFVLCGLISLWMLGGLYARPITVFVQQFWPDFGYEGEQLLLWGGLFLSGLGISLLVFYLLLGL